MWYLKGTQWINIKDYEGQVVVFSRKSFKVLNNVNVFDVCKYYREKGYKYVKGTPF